MFCTLTSFSFVFLAWVSILYRYAVTFDVVGALYKLSAHYALTCAAVCVQCRGPLPAEIGILGFPNFADDGRWRAETRGVWE